MEGSLHSDPGDRGIPPQKKINKNLSKPQHLIVKFANSKDKEKILKAARDNRFVTYMGRNI